MAGTPTKFLARDITVEVSSDGTEYGDWTRVGGLQTLTHTPSTTRTETTDFDDAGVANHLVAERGDSWALAGMAEEDADTGDKDPGQEIIELLAREFSNDAFGLFRMTSPGGNAITFHASAEVKLASGGRNDAATWDATLTVSGGHSYS